MCCGIIILFYMGRGGPIEAAAEEVESRFVSLFVGGSTVGPAFTKVTASGTRIKEATNLVESLTSNTFRCKIKKNRP